MIPDPPRKLWFDAVRLAISERPRSLFIGLTALVIPFFQVNVFLMAFSPYLGELRNSTIRSSGKATQGQVLRVEEARGFSVNGVQPKVVFFGYKSDGIERERSMTTLSVHMVSGWKKGQTVPVLYDDKSAIVEGLEPATLPLAGAMMILSAAAWILIAIPLLAYSVSGIRRRYRLLKAGVPRKGTLISFEAVGSFLYPTSRLRSFLPWTSVGSFDALLSQGPVERFLVTYSYVDSAGHEFVGRAPSRDLTLLKGKNKGDQIEILVLPADERRSTLLDSPTERVLLRA